MCNLALVLVAGVYLNPCLITHMKDSVCYKQDNPFAEEIECCYVEFNSGNAWSGTDNTTVSTSCKKVQEEFEKQKGGKK